MAIGHDHARLLVTDLDIGQAALFLGWASTEAVLGHLAQAGFDDVRPGHGLVIQRLVEGEGPAPTEIADALGVTTASVSRSLRELADGGYVEHLRDPGDGRRRNVHLTDRGRALVEAARDARADFDASLRRHLGTAATARLRSILHAALEAAGAAERVADRRMRDPTG